MIGDWVIAGIIIVMMATLLIYLVFLYCSKERSEKIEKRGMIPFLDEPLEDKSK